MECTYHHNTLLDLNMFINVPDKRYDKQNISTVVKFVIVCNLMTTKPVILFFK